MEKRSFPRSPNSASPPPRSCSKIPTCPFPRSAKKWAIRINACFSPLSKKHKALPPRNTAIKTVLSVLPYIATTLRPNTRWTWTPTQRKHSTAKHEKRARSVPSYFHGGGGGIRTPVALPPNGFQDRLVMTASIRLRILFVYFCVTLLFFTCFLFGSAFATSLLG